MTLPKVKLKRQENVELIEMCEHSDKPQCPHCLSCSPTGQICCTCGTLLYMEQSDPLRNQFVNVTKLWQKATNPHYTMITSGRGRRHGKSERQELHHKAQYALRDAQFYPAPVPHGRRVPRVPNIYSRMDETVTLSQISPTLLLRKKDNGIQNIGSFENIWRIHHVGAKI